MVRARASIVGAVAALVASTGVVGFAFAADGQPPAVGITPTEGARDSEVTISWSCADGDVVDVSDAQVVSEPATSTTGSAEVGDPTVTAGDLADGSTIVAVGDHPVGTELSWTVTCTGPDATVTESSPTFTVTEVEAGTPLDGEPAADEPVTAAELIGPAAVPGATLTTVDATDTTGLFTSLQIDGSGNPVISYWNGDLRLARCDNPTCTMATLTTVDAGFTGLLTSLQIDGSGNPVISYNDFTNFDLHLARCDNPTCTTATLTTVDATGSYPSLQIDGSDNPVISYNDFTNGDLRLARCDNPTCTTATLTTVDATDTTGQFTSLQIDGSGNPVISYYDETNGDLRLARCDTSTCVAGFEVTVTLAGTGTGTVTSVPVPINCPGVCTGAYPDAAAVTLTATPSAGSTFIGWTGCDSNPTIETCLVTVSADRVVSATFTAITFDVAVTLAGTGTGTVTSIPGLINCPGVCTGTFSSGTPVTLTATPAARSTLSGWTGCDSNPTIETCLVTVSADRVVAVTFAAVTPTTTTTTTIAPGTGSGRSGLLASTGATILAIVAAAITLIATGSLAVGARRRH